MSYRPEQQPRGSRDHDIFLVRKRRPEEGDLDEARKPAVLDHFKVLKEGPDEGRRPYLDHGDPDGRRPHVGFEADFHRPLLNLAFPDGEEQRLGPVFSALPVHPDPAATSACSCYLINTANLRYETVWTSEEWNQVPGHDSGDANVGSDKIDVLIATAAGNVYRVTSPKDGKNLTAVSVDLKKQPQIWVQLRNGCVVGRTSYQPEAGKPEPLPLLNVHSFI